MNAMIIKESSRGYDCYSTESALLRERIVFFTEEVCPASCNQLIEYLIYLDKDDPGREITICINSPGGEVDSGLAVYDMVKLIKSPIRTVCIGTAASMGAILFLAGDKREMLPRTRLMLHDPLINGINGGRKALELWKEAGQLMETRNVLAGIISERSNMELDEVFEMTKEDCYLTAEEAINLGLATAIAEGI